MSQPTVHPVDQQLATQTQADWRDYLALLKPRVISLVVFTGAVGLFIAPSQPHPVIAVTAILALALGAGAAGAINMWYDADIDARMERTKHRPIPAGRIARGEALGFAVTLAVIAVTLMALHVNLLAAGLLAFSILFYGVVYTMMLKRHTPQNIVIGGAAGAFPPLIGWAAATGDIALMPVILFAIIFLWTPPHFWALSLVSTADYARVGIPMLPVVKGRRSTRFHIVGYTFALVGVSVLPWVLSLTGPLYAVTALLLGMIFVLASLKLQRSDSSADAWRVFGFSIFYLFALFVAIAADHMIGTA